MSVFLVWMTATLMILGFYLFSLWLRQRHCSRFQTKLTILFLLFVLVPTVPLTFLTAQLMTGSANMLIMPGIARALETSLKTMRSQLEEKGVSSLGSLNLEKIPEKSELMNRGISLWGLYRRGKNGIQSLLTVASEPTILKPSWLPSNEHFITDTAYSSSLTTHSRGMLIHVYRHLDDTTLMMAVYPVPEYTIQAKNAVEQAASIYGSLSFIKESIVEKNLIWALAALLVAGLAVLSVTAARILSRGIHEPIQNLVDGMKKAAEGKIPEEVSTKAKDEFRFLVDTFNTMVHELSVNRQRLIEMERIAAWQDVARQVSHELKNSLTPIIISLRRIRNQFQEQTLPKDLLNNLKAVEEEVHSMETISSEFSSFARLPSPKKETVNINDLLRTVLVLARTTSSVSIQSELDETLPSIEADGEQLKRVFTNLIKNSVEASHEGQTVTIRTRLNDSETHPIEIEIQDTGKGMDEDTLNKLFIPYFTTKKKGMGLGMAIVRKIIDDHLGRITVTSRLGEGTRFNIKF